ncbi:wall-associated receptor kinase-like 14 isoform X2 [Quercus lobata]|uniref:wall-associated receptor kinase-like 14 isoform X2 n=1 Tax=Quercus lobata TaxID=97700 RepID=UPI0012481B3A|nr:wall-associated receptor kinase-like 14 isoform X2 [Quercus lobata]
MIPFRIIVSIFIIVFPIPTRAQSKDACNSTCGSGGKTVTVQYPFGFSGSCPIRLHCASNSEIQLNDKELSLQVAHITSQSIFLNLSDDCRRPIESIEPLFNESNNYRPTRQNSLLLKNCNRTQPNDCVLSTSLFPFNSNTCNSNSKSGDNVSCFSQQSGVGNKKQQKFLDLKAVQNTTCKTVFSSIFVEYNGNGSPLSLQFHTLELQWWLNGSCSSSTSICSNDSNCTDVKSDDGRFLGFRCSCKNGFRGDGYHGGEGCRKISACNPKRYLSGKCGSNSKVRFLLGGFAAGASIVAGLFLFCYFIRRRSTCLKNQMSTRRLVCEAAGNSSVPLYPYKDIERATNSFCEKQRLGTGAFGTVYAGKLHNNEWVAIKKIKHRDNNGIDQVLNEIKLLSCVSHPNLVRLLGCCIEEGEQILVYEFMPNGTLSQHLQRERGPGLPWTIRLTIAAETANAIAYLHSAMNPPIYHRDIKSSNILLDFSFKSKVADFGLSRLGLTETSHISTAPQGTPGYVDPQYHQNFHLSDKSDVYSFGVVLIEIITALKVVDFGRPQTEVNLAALAIDRIGKGCLDEIIDPFLEPHRDAWTLYSIHKVAELAFRCLAFHSDMRPSMMEVAEELEHIRRSGWASFEENICMAASVVSSCSSPRNGSMKSLDGMVVGKAGVESQRLFGLKKVNDCLASLEEVKDCSPVSVHDVWLSDQSSPSTNSLLGKM